ncbi:hypothetical protein BH11MYX3_BH11MYX3_34490 [soil metagenome]
MITKLLTAVALLGAPATALASPRTLPSGAPACGNTMGKGGYNDDCTAEQRAAAKVEKARIRAAEVTAMRANLLALQVRTIVDHVVLTVPVLARLRG